MSDDNTLIICIMLHCLICSKSCPNLEQKLLEAFYDCRSHFYICIKCFKRATQFKNTSTYKRVSLLTNHISSKRKLLHERLHKFVQANNFTVQQLFELNIFSEFLLSIDKKNDSEQLSIAFSIDTSENNISSIEPIDKYSWLRDQISQNYEYFKGGSQKLSEKIMPFQEKVKHSAAQIGQKLSSFRSQLRSFGKQVPSFEKINLSGLWRSQKFSSFF